MNRMFVILGLTGLVAAPIQAGLTYRFSIVDEGSIVAPRVAGRVWLDGDKARVELQEDGGNAAHVRDLLIAPGDGRILALHSGERTYFEVSSTDPFAVTDIATARVDHAERRARRLSDVEVSLVDGSEPQSVAKLASRKYELRISFRVTVDYSSEKVQQHYSAAVSVWTTDELEGEPAILNLRVFRTGYGEIDQEVARILAQLPGFAVKQEQLVTRQYAGSTPVSRRKIGDPRRVCRGTDSSVTVHDSRGVSLPAAGLRKPEPGCCADDVHAGGERSATDAGSCGPLRRGSRPG